MKLLQVVYSIQLCIGVQLITIVRISNVVYSRYTEWVLFVCLGLTMFRAGSPGTKNWCVHGLIQGSALEQMTTNMEYNATQKRKSFKSLPWNSSKFGGSPGCCKPPLHEQAYLEIKRCIIYYLWFYIIHIHWYIYIYTVFTYMYFYWFFIYFIYTYTGPSKGWQIDGKRCNQSTL